jgi:carbamoyltransferase
MLKAFADKTGCPVLINTSFNVRGEPLVCTPEHAYVCFMRTNMDCLVLGNFLLEKTEQKPLDKDVAWLREFELD